MVSRLVVREEHTDAILRANWVDLDHNVAFGWKPEGGRMRRTPWPGRGPLLLVCALSVTAACSPPVEQEAVQAADVTVFEGARLIAGDGAEPIENAAFVVQDDRITAVGRRGELQVPAGAARVDLTGKTVMPTLHDLHVHFRGPREDYVDGLERQAYFGVGAILNIGSPADLSADLRNNPIPGAALYLDGGRGIRGPSDKGVTSAAEARKAVQEHAAQKVDMVKIYVDDRFGEVKTLTPEMYGALIDEADLHGLRTYAHLRYLRDAKGLLKAGLHGFAHGVRDQELDQEFVAMMKERPEVFLVPNLPPRGVMPDLSWIRDAYPADAFEEILKEARTGSTPLAFGLQRPKEPYDIQAANLRTLLGEGVKMGVGTDSNVGWSVHIEMEDMVKAGMTPAQVILAATRGSAEIMRLSDYGTLAPGKSASFVVLDANPLDEITNTRRIAEVYIRGTAVDRAALRARWTGGAWRRHANS
jgi:imidazolonepropionase-like amidohydrolase